MKKNKLIALLKAIEGNPEIYLWNGYTEDWMDVDKEFIHCTFVKEHDKGSKFDFKNPFVEPSEMNNWYTSHRKKVVIITAKSRGKTCYDRTGKINY